jgi:hypothetical protein
MSDEAWFHLCGHRTRGIGRRRTLTSGMSSHSMIKKIGIWCAVLGTRIIGPIVFDRTVNTEVYMNIFEEFCAQLTEEERQSFFFQQDGATCHTSRVSL